MKAEAQPEVQAAEDSMIDTSQRKRDVKQQEKTQARENQIQRQSSSNTRARLPVGIYSDDGEQGWNFNALITLDDPIVCDIYEAAIEVVSK